MISNSEKKMKNLVVIGHSHTGCIKKAARNSDNIQVINVNFFQEKGEPLTKAAISASIKSLWGV